MFALLMLSMQIIEQFIQKCHSFGKILKGPVFYTSIEERSTTITTDDTLFICPRCGEPALAIHRKTYEKTVIFFCTNCHLTQTYEPSKTAYLDPQLSWQEFTTKYRQKIKA
jgi:predicted RNA-binding Zn-ribbon protein involved in translation (DUF1610 family)